MRRVFTSIVALALAAGSTSLSAQTPDPERHRRHPHGSAPAPIARMLEHREELGLTDQQVARIEQIQAALEASNRPLAERLRSTVGDSVLPHRGSRLTEEQRAAIRPLLDQMRDNRTEAMRELREVLTPEQQSRLRELRPHRSEHRRGGVGRGTGARG